MKNWKKLICLLMVLCILPIMAQASEDSHLEGYVLDQKYVMSNMDKSWFQGYEPVVSGDRVRICLPITSKSSDGKLVATLILDDEEIAPIRSENRSIKVYREDGMFDVELSLKLSASRINGDYSGKVRLEGENKNDQFMVTEYPVVIRIRDGRDVVVQPHISDVRAELNVGEDGVIRAKFTNTSRYAELTNLLLTVTDASGDVVPLASDTLKLGTVKPNQTIDIEYPVSVKPNASVSLHKLTFNLTYTAAGKDGTWTETFTVPVSQQMRLEQGGVQMATTAVQGDIASVTLPLMNMGRGDINNVMATLSIPEVVERQSVLVGTIAPGETKQAKLNFTPGKNILGDAAGTITVTAEDAWGNQTEFSLPVELTIEEPVKLTMSGEAEKEEDKPPYLMYVFIGLSALLAIALVLQGMLLGGKIRKLEEDRL